MHKPFSVFVEQAMELAAAKGVPWDAAFKSDDSKSGWNLTEIVNSRPPSHYLRNFKKDSGALKILNEDRCGNGLPPLHSEKISFSWQELIKAETCYQLFVRRTTTGHISQNVIRPLRVIATCCNELEPYELTSESARLAIGVANRLQASGRLADVIAGLVRSLFDVNHLSAVSPLYPHLSFTRLPSGRNRSSRLVKSKANLRDELEQRKRSERLPEKRAFWELVRIVFTEKPASYTDALRFAAIKVMIICGLRVGEATLLPADWKRQREYYDHRGRPAGELGGYSKAIMLRHFAEKQQTPMSDSRVMYETSQYIPAMFEEILQDTLDSVVKITQPLRKTLKRQEETGRLMPWYDANSLIPVTELYPRISGNPFWLGLQEEDVKQFSDQYRNEFSPTVWDDLQRFQYDLYSSPTGSQSLNFAMYMYFNRMEKLGFRKDTAPLLFRHTDGRPYTAKRKKWSEVYLHIGELENYLASAAPSKMPDLQPYPLSSGHLKSWEMLFLLPKRSLAEERNGGLTDITRYYSVGTPAPGLVMDVLGEQASKPNTIFAKYGKTEEDKKLILTSHSLRHLQNTELFRLGVADTIITKRFNRRSVAQSYEHDHRSLSEELEAIDLPEEVEISLGDKASTVAKMIKSGRASGPITDKFRSIQAEQGDQAAFEYLRVEADGFHATPYGHCINSFTVDPCPKNLECFSGCRHLTATNLPENRKHLEDLEGRLKSTLETAELRQGSSVGIENQIGHARSRLESVRKLLDTRTGQQVFPDGPGLISGAAIYPDKCIR